MNNYQENGFYLAKNLLSEDDLAPIKNTVFGLINNFFSLSNLDGINSTESVEYAKMFPGETRAVDEVLAISNIRIERFPFDSYVSYAVIE